MVNFFAHNKSYLLLLLGCLLFLPFLGYVNLFDWDEINFAESAREMMISGNYFQNQIDFEPFWQKPPLFAWLQSLSMSIFGVNEFGARFPNALCGIITLMVLFRMGKQLFNERFGLLWALLYAGTLLPHLYFKSGIIDPVFNLFIFLSIWKIIFIVRNTSPPLNWKYAIWGGLFLGLAIITKGPVALIIVLLTVGVFWGLNRFKAIATIKNLLVFAVITLLTSCLWFGFETIKNGPAFLVEFLAYQIELFTGEEGGAAAGHQQPFYYHFLVVGIGCLPISILAFSRRQNSKIKDSSIDLVRWMSILFWVVMILFSIVSTKIVHYSSMAYFPLSFLACYYLFQVDIGKIKLNKIGFWIMSILYLIVGLAVFALPIVLIFKESLLLPFVKEPFAANAILTEVEMLGFEWIIGLFFLIGIIISIIQLYKNNVLQFAFYNVLFLGVTLILTTVFTLPQIEQLSQGTAIEFLQSKRNEDCYIYPITYKSYAHYFYARTQPLKKTDGLYSAKKDALKSLDAVSVNELDTPHNQWKYKELVKDYLINGEVDKPTYLLLKSHHYNPEHHPKSNVILKKGGFTVLKRK